MLIEKVTLASYVLTYCSPVIKSLCIAAVRVDGSAVDVVDEEVSSVADLSEGEVRRGYVVSAGSVGVLVRLATEAVVDTSLEQYAVSCALFQLIS